MNGMGRFHHGFTKSRVGVNGAAELFGGNFQAHGRNRFRDQVGRVRTDNVDAENLIGFCVGNDFTKAFGIIDRHCFTEGGKWEFADIYFDSLFFTLFLLFLRFLPMVAMSEVKGVLPEADPHHGGSH